MLPVSEASSKSTVKMGTFCAKWQVGICHFWKWRLLFQAYEEKSRLLTFVVLEILF